LFWFFLCILSSLHLAVTSCSGAILPHGTSLGNSTSSLSFHLLYTVRILLAGVTFSENEWSAHTIPYITACVPTCSRHSSFTVWPLHMGLIGCPESMLTTFLPYVTSQKCEDLIHIMSTIYTSNLKYSWWLCTFQAGLFWLKQCLQCPWLSRL
jgi:hypothetical protein